MVARLAANNVGESAPKPGEAMPDFILPDEGGRLVRLTDLIDKGPVVLSFNRGHWCPYCRLNVAGLAEIAPDVESLGAQIVAISPEKARYGKELKSYAKAPFPVLADINNAYALELNLLFWVGDEKREAMQAGGYDIAPYQGNDAWMLPIPATFIVDRDGVVRARYIDPDYRRRMDLDELLAALRSFIGTGSLRAHRRRSRVGTRGKVRRCHVAPTSAVRRVHMFLSRKSSRSNCPLMDGSGSRPT